MEFYAIKPGFTYFGYEVYRINIGEEKIEGIYLGKLFSRREKLRIAFASLFYALLGGYFFGIHGYALAALASPDIELKIGKSERKKKKDFYWKMEEVKIRVRENGLLKIKGKKRYKFIVDDCIIRELIKMR